MATYVISERRSSGEWVPVHYGQAMDARAAVQGIAPGRPLYGRSDIGQDTYADLIHDGWHIYRAVEVPLDETMRYQGAWRVARAVGYGGEYSDWLQLSQAERLAVLQPTGWLPD